MTDNPYAPSAVDPTPEATQEMWRVEGKFLLVRDGAVLPPEIPLVGCAEGELNREFKKLRAPTRWLRFCGVAAYLLYQLIPQQLRMMLPGWLGFLPGILIVTLFVSLHRCMARRFSITYTVDRRALRRRKWMQGISFPIFLMGLGGLLRGPASDVLAFVYLAVCMGGLACFLISSLNTLACVKYKDQWFYLRGIHQKKLRQLDEMSVKELSVSS